MANIKLVSWNVNGIRSILKHGFIEAINKLNPDILCLQETKAQKEDVRNILSLMPDYQKLFVNSSKTRKGYSGTAVFSHLNPLTGTYDLGIVDHDQEGRVITIEFQEFFLVNVYVPNSKRGLLRLDYRSIWDRDFLIYLKKLEEQKPVVACGDFNVAHQAMDLANPKSNYNKTAGYTQIEIDGFSNIQNAGFIDTFRYFNPNEIAYTYWSYLFNARKNNKGWRIDYFMVSENIIDKVISSKIFPEFPGSDHCPIGLELKI